MVYAGVFVGVPYQDPTQAQSASQAFHADVVSVIFLTGLAMVALGILLRVIRAGLSYKQSAFSRNEH